MATTVKSELRLDNYIRIQFPSHSENESFARVAVASFVAQLDPTVEELTELKTAVSEAVTNSIIHGYAEAFGEVRIECSMFEHSVVIVVEDDGVGIENIEEAKQPLFTSRPELERSGMGLTIMETFVDELTITSTAGCGTRVQMTKHFSGSAYRH